MYQGSTTVTAPKKVMTSTIVERSSAQIIKQPRMKKGVQRQQVKAHCARRQPANSSIAQHKLDQDLSCSGKRANSCKRIVPQSQERKLKSCFGGLVESLAKFNLESKVGSIPPKMANTQKLTQPNSPAMKAEDRNVSGDGVCKVKKPQPPLAGKPRKFSGTRENQRLKPAAAEKKRYQSVSEYQFICPGRRVFHCTKASLKQQLRSIYLGHSSVKLLKPTHQASRMPRGQQEKAQAQRRKLNMDVKCPVGSEFLRTIYPNMTPHGLMSLSHKISKMALVNVKPVASPENLSATAGHEAAPHKLTHPLEDCQPSAERKASQDEGKAEQVFDPGPEATGNVLKAPHTCSAKLAKQRPKSAKDYDRSLLEVKSATADCSKNEDVAGSLANLNSTIQGAIAPTKRATIIPATLDQLSSNENGSTEASPNAHLSSAPCPAEVRQDIPHAIAYSEPMPALEKLGSALAGYSSGEKAQSHFLATTGSES